MDKNGNMKNGVPFRFAKGPWVSRMGSKLQYFKSYSKYIILASTDGTYSGIPSVQAFSFVTNVYLDLPVKHQSNHEKIL